MFTNPEFVTKCPFGLVADYTNVTVWTPYKSNQAINMNKTSMNMV